MEKCLYCNKELKNKLALAGHTRACSLNPNAIGSPFKKRWTEGLPVWNKGLTRDTDERVKLAADKNSKTHLESPTFLGKTHSEKSRQKMSDSRHKLYESGWEPVCGRSKKYDYTSLTAGTIKVDGTWELKVCHYLDSLGVKWERNRKRFPYIRPDGKKATYQPDFYVADWESFIEVKGYQTDLDECKWAQFPHKLEVWKRDKIMNL
jgi:hypothetical protein